MPFLIRASGGCLDDAFSLPAMKNDRRAAITCQPLGRCWANPAAAGSPAPLGERACAAAGRGLQCGVSGVREGPAPSRPGRRWLPPAGPGRAGAGLRCAALRCLLCPGCGLRPAQHERLLRRPRGHQQPPGR